MSLHNYYAAYARTSRGFARRCDGDEGINAGGHRADGSFAPARLSRIIPGPVLFDAPAADSVLAQLLPASLSGARPPLSMVARFDEMMESMGGRSEWSGRVSTRVLPTECDAVDDPTMKDFKGQPLLGSYDVDDEGVKAQSVTLVDKAS